MDTNTKFYHRPTHTCLVAGGLPAELLKDIRAELPEEDQYSLKFVVFVVNQGMSGQMDTEWFVDAMEKLGMWSMSGMTLSALHSALVEKGFDKVQVVHPVRLTSESRPFISADHPHTNGKNGHNGHNGHTPKKSSRATAPKGIKLLPSPRVAPVKARITITPGMEVEVKDPRRKQHGKVLTIEGGKAKIQWDSGTTRLVGLERLSNPRKYELK